MALSDFAILDPRFRRLVVASATVRRLFTGCAWAEGPAYVPAYRLLIWSDTPNDRMLAYNEREGSVTLFREPAGYSNGNCLDREGRLITCQHGFRSVTRTEHDGSVITLADRLGDKRFNSPNDVVCKSDGTIWFSDPTYGIDSDYEGHKAPSEIAASWLFRLDMDGTIEAVVTDFVQPNGLAFPPDERLLYVADTGASHIVDGPRHIRRFVVGDDNQLTDDGIFATCSNGVFDGFRLDSAGRIWASAADGVHCYDPDGTLLGKILVPERVANVCFGGPKRNVLYICATTSLYAITLPVNGAN
ncbi:MAG TPA: SMP-30/gluconolactonase/LRE family protein [Devosia sp.]|nr:SMP-30/gluconolactonase/LRE family protein [Devosia sp.]